MNKIPLQCLEAEQAVLGAVLRDNEAFSKALEVLDQKSFYREAHRLIFSTMVELVERNEMIRAAGGRDAEESANGDQSASGGEDRAFRSFGEQLQAIATAQLTGVVDQRLVEIRATGLSEGVPAFRG